MDSETAPESKEEHHDPKEEQWKPKTLGGQTYTLFPLHPPESTLVKRIFTPFAMLTFSPLILTMVGSLTTIMYWGPKSIKSKLLSIMIPKGMGRVAEFFGDARKAILSPERISNCKVLDLGSGGGAYMRHLSSASHIVALEPIADMHATIQDVAKEAGICIEKNLEILDCDIEEYMEKHPKEVGSFDWVILGNVLCEVDCQSSTLRKVDQILKVGGRVYFSEHVAYPAGTNMRLFQDWVAPWWRTVMGGCNCNRDTMMQIEKMTNWKIIHWTYDTAPSPPTIGPFEIGVALKEKEASGN